MASLSAQSSATSADIQGQLTTATFQSVEEHKKLQTLSCVISWFKTLKLKDPDLTPFAVNPNTTETHSPDTANTSDIAIVSSLMSLFVLENEVVAGAAVDDSPEARRVMPNSEFKGYLVFTGNTANNAKSNSKEPSSNVGPENASQKSAHVLEVTQVHLDPFDEVTKNVTDSDIRRLVKKFADETASKKRVSFFADGWPKHCASVLNLAKRERFAELRTYSYIFSSFKQQRRIRKFENTYSYGKVFRFKEIAEKHLSTDSDQVYTESGCRKCERFSHDNPHLTQQIRDVRQSDIYKNEFSTNQDKDLVHRILNFLGNTDQSQYAQTCVSRPAFHQMLKDLLALIAESLTNFHNALDTVRNLENDERALFRELAEVTKPRRKGQKATQLLAELMFWFPQVILSHLKWLDAHGYPAAIQTSSVESQEKFPTATDAVSGALLAHGDEVQRAMFETLIANNQTQPSNNNNISQAIIDDVRSRQDHHAATPATTLTKSQNNEPASGDSDQDEDSFAATDDHSEWSDRAFKALELICRFENSIRLLEETVKSDPVAFKKVLSQLEPTCIEGSILNRIRTSEFAGSPMSTIWDAYLKRSGSQGKYSQNEAITMTQWFAEHFGPLKHVGIAENVRVGCFYKRLSAAPSRDKRQNSSRFGYGQPVDLFWGPEYHTTIWPNSHKNPTEKPVQKQQFDLAAWAPVHGAYHAEHILLSLAILSKLDKDDRLDRDGAPVRLPPKPILDKVMGLGASLAVSKRSCPTCSILIHNLHREGKVLNEALLCPHRNWWSVMFVEWLPEAYCKEIEKYHTHQANRILSYDIRKTTTSHASQESAGLRLKP